MIHNGLSSANGFSEWFMIIHDGLLVIDGNIPSGNQTYLWKTSPFLYNW